MNDQAPAYASSASAPVEPDAVHSPAEQSSQISAAGEAPFDDAARALLSERLNAVRDAADPVAELDAVVDALADELSRRPRANDDREIAPEREGEIEGAIETLIGVALGADDPVTALEEGAESLAEALAERDIAAADHLRAAHERQIDEQAAYRHARLHRVTELMDVGYDLDHAVAITNANEADIVARAVAMGRSPMEPIHEYAVLNGYQGARSGRAWPSVRGRSPMARSQPNRPNAQPSAMEALAQLNDEAFAEATEGDRWQSLMRR